MNGAPESAGKRHFFFGAETFLLSNPAVDGLPADHFRAVLVVPLALVRNPVTLRFLSCVARDAGAARDQDARGGEP